MVLALLKFWLTETLAKEPVNTPKRSATCEIVRNVRNVKIAQKIPAATAAAAILCHHHRRSRGGRGRQPSGEAATPPDEATAPPDKATTPSGETPAHNRPVHSPSWVGPGRRAGHTLVRPIQTGLVYRTAVSSIVSAAELLQYGCLRIFSVIGSCHEEN